MNIKVTKSRDVLWIPRRMHRSPAFRKLTKSAIHIYLEFRYRCKMAQIPEKAGRAKEWTISNNGELIFTYDDAVNRFGIARSTFRNCIDLLVKYGFIDIAHAGGGMMKDCSKYGISERWKNYGKEKFKKKSRQKDTRKLGFQTGDKWEKQTGRKRKSQPKISITDDTKSSIRNDTRDQQMPVTPSIVHATHKKDLNYFIEKGLEVLEAMHSTQYH
jgi:hypothetical protein